VYQTACEIFWFMRVLEFLQDPSGGFSSNRLTFLLWALAPLAIWTFVSVVKQNLQPIDNSVLMAMGIFTTGKVVQRFGEKDTEPPTAITPKPTA
jgi:hypothetical protein